MVDEHANHEKVNAGDFPMWIKIALSDKQNGHRVTL